MSLICLAAHVSMWLEVKFLKFLPQFSVFSLFSFRLFDCRQHLFTPAVWHNVNPLLDHRVHFASLRTSQHLLDYLQSSAVVLELWGLQGEDECMTKWIQHGFLYL